jgi:hypothetical protein
MSLQTLDAGVRSAFEDAHVAMFRPRQLVGPQRRLGIRSQGRELSIGVLDLSSASQQSGVIADQGRQHRRGQSSRDWATRLPEVER